MKRRYKIGFAAIIAVLLGLPAQAAVVTTAWYRAGEGDGGAVAGNYNGGAAAADSSGNGLHIQNTSLFWSANVVPPASTPLATSTLSYNFTPGTLAYRNVPGLVTTATDNMGMEMWVKPANDTQTALLAQNGGLSGGASSPSGFGLYQTGSAFVGHVAGVSFVGSATVSTTEWTYLALVRNGGIWQFYVNGSLNATSAVSPNAYDVPNNTFMLAANVYTPGGSDYYSGLMDEVRVFTFAPGGFSVSDLNYTAVPEPSGLLLLLSAGGLLVLGRRSMRR